MVWYMVSYHIISRLWAESTSTLTSNVPLAHWGGLATHVPLAHFLINHIIVYISQIPTHQVYASVARKALGFTQHYYCNS